MSRPEEHLKALLSEYRKLARNVEELYLMKGKEETWPDDVLLPFGAWMAIEGYYHPETDPCAGELNESVIAGLVKAHRLAAVGSWRYGKGVYKFSYELYDALIKTPIPEIIPLRSFRRLPDWCPYLELPEPVNGIYGYYCYLDYEKRSGAWELRITLDDGKWTTTPIELTEGISIYESIATFASEKEVDALLKIEGAGEKIKKNVIDDITIALSLLLYLCQDAPEIDDDREPGESPSRVYPKKVKGGFRLFEPPKVRTWEVGKALSESLALGKASVKGKISPHIRRAHWHGYWTGPKDSKRKFVYHWIPPTMIAVE